MTEEQAKQLLQKYLDGKITSSESEKVERWYALLNREHSEISADRKREIGNHIFGELQMAMRSERVRRFAYFRNTWFKIAACLLLSLSIGFAVSKLNRTVNNKIHFITLTTEANQKRKLKFSDGSEIILGSSAKISYPAKFTATSRTVELREGEAFFDITHDEKRPFNVKTASGLNIQVLGTSFQVKSYQNSHKVEVAVATGKVAVMNNKRLLGTLIKDQQLEFDKHTGYAAIHHSNSERYVQFSFQGTTLKEVIEKLEYVYSIKIRLTDPRLAGLKCTATFSSSQKPEEILDILCSLHHIKFIQNQDHKTFKINP